MKLFKKIKDVISASILCLRFPFLYPRNRFDGKHHCCVLGSLRYRLQNKSLQKINITAKLDKTGERYWDRSDFFDYSCKLDKINKKLIIKNKLESKEIDLSRLLWSDDRFEILGIDLQFSLTGLPIIIVIVTPFDGTDNTNYGFCYLHEDFTINKWYNFWYKTITWFDTKVLDKILFLPSYTELDAMEPGWRKVFGIQMCKEIKKELKKHKFLYKYRIVQIKEKWDIFIGMIVELQKILKFMI